MLPRLFSKNRNFSFLKNHNFSRDFFTISLTYQVPMSEVDKYIPEHKQFLKDCYEKGIFIASGPKIPRTGGIILASASNREDLDKIIKTDPFYKNKIATYEIIEFSPTMFSNYFEPIADNDNQITKKT